MDTVDRLEVFLNKNYIISNQYGFRPGFYAADAVLNFTQLVTNHLDASDGLGMLRRSASVSASAK